MLAHYFYSSAKKYVHLLKISTKKVGAFLEAIVLQMDILKILKRDNVPQSSSQAQ